MVSNWLLTWLLTWLVTIKGDYMPIAKAQIQKERREESILMLNILEKILAGGELDEQDAKLCNKIAKRREARLKRV